MKHNGVQHEDSTATSTVKHLGEALRPRTAAHRFQQKANKEQQKSSKTKLIPPPRQQNEFPLGGSAGRKNPANSKPPISKTPKPVGAPQEYMRNKKHLLLQESSWNKNLTLNSWGQLFIGDVKRDSNPTFFYTDHCVVSLRTFFWKLGGGFKYFLFLPQNPAEMIQFDWIFSTGWFNHHLLLMAEFLLTSWGW